MSRYPIDKEKWMEISAANFGEDYTETDREMDVLIVDLLNRAYYAGVEDGRNGGAA